MAVRKLTIAISEYDTDIKTVVAPALQGGLDVTYKKYSTLSSLADYEGGDKYPLTLVGHANQLNFKTGPTTYISAETVADELLGKNLDPQTFPFCLVAGCNGANVQGGVAMNALFVKLGDKLKIPVVACTKAVSISRDAGNVFLTPQDSGHWRVYYPSVGGGDIYSLHTTGRCKDILAHMENQEFKCKQ